MAIDVYKFAAILGAGVVLAARLPAQTTDAPPGLSNTVPNVAPGSKAVAAEALPKLLVGDAAPELSIATWVRGTPVSKFEAGRVYVVEFWATWCPPCRRSIPHLTELQNKYKDAVTVIGVTSREPDGVERVEQFVRQSGDRFGFAVAWDDAGKSDLAWMEGTGQDGIPTAFVVDKAGRLAWIGHPLEGLDATLEQVVKGTFDLSAAAAQARKEAEVNARAVPLKAKLEDQLGEARFAEAGRTIDQLIALDPAIMGEYALMKFTLLATGGKDIDAADAYAQGAIDGALKDNPRLLGLLAWIIAEDPSIEKRNFDVAERAASRAVEASGGKSAAALAALARVKLGRNQVTTAVELQTRAVELEPSPTLRAEFQARLDQYKAKLPPEKQPVKPK